MARSLDTLDRFYQDRINGVEIFSEVIGWLFQKSLDSASSSRSNTSVLSLIGIADDFSGNTDEFPLYELFGG